MFPKNGMLSILHTIFRTKNMNNNLRVQKRSFDYITFFLMLTLSACGLMFVLSATYTPEQPLSSFFIKQCIGICGGIIIYFLCLLPDYRNLMQWGYMAYFGIIALLIFTLIKGSVG